MNYLNFVFLIIILIISISGCAGIEPPSPEKLVTPWNSMTSIRIGDTKEKVISKWGKPNMVHKIGVDELGTEKEEWVYYGKYPIAPIDDQYLSKNRYLYFEGNNLVDIESKAKALPKEE